MFDLKYTTQIVTSQTETEIHVDPPYIHFEFSKIGQIVYQCNFEF